MKQLNQLRNPNCDLCPLHEHARHICLIGKGSSNAKIMLIGESPGEEEDKLGQPFVGKAGKLLDSILGEIGIDRKEIFISNVLKCHPPFNSKPPIETLRICSDTYLRREIALIRPQIIVCLGGMAAKVLLQENNIQVANVRDKIWRTKKPLPSGIPFIVTYHPAATFHQDHLLRFIVDDLKKAKKLSTGKLTKLKSGTIYKKLDNILKIPGIRDAKWIDLDLETDGLDPFLPNKTILSVQISIKEKEAYYFDWNESIRNQLAFILSSKNLTTGVYHIKVNGHNIKHDLKWLRVIGKIIFDGEVNCTLQNIYLLDENFPRKGLDVVTSSFTELKGHKDQFVNLINAFVKINKEKKEPITQARSRLWKRAFKSIPERIRTKYGCGDADATGRLRRIFLPKIKEADLIPLNRLMNNVIPMYVDIECNGIKISVKELDRLDKKYKKKIKLLWKELRLFKKINHRSNLKLRKLIYGTWGLPPHRIKMGKKYVRYSTGKDAIDKLLADSRVSDKHKAYLSKLSEYRKINKLHSTYISGMYKHLREGDLIHPNFNLTGPVTGRTSSKPNVQNIPRTGDIKGFIISRFRKGILAQLDVSQGELRIIAHVANVKRLIKLFNSGTTDIHRSVGAELLHKKFDEVTTDERYNAKQVNFAIAYDSGARTVAGEMKGITEDEAFDFINRWNELFPEWNEYKEWLKQHIIENHFVRNLFGRYRRIFVIDPYSAEGAAKIRQAGNAPIQGGLSDYLKLCAYNTWRRIRKEGLQKKILIINEVHDNLQFDVAHKKYLPVWYKIVKEEFENVDTSEFGFKFKVPMKIDCKIGYNLKDMEDYNGSQK